MTDVQHHITYIRDADRTRVVFVLPGTMTAEDARAQADTMQPRAGSYGSFRFAGQRVHEGGEIVIPGDGDDYRG